MLWSTLREIQVGPIYSKLVLGLMWAVPVCAGVRQCTMPQSVFIPKQHASLKHLESFKIPSSFTFK